jgi:hypothetical protein
MNRAGVQGLDVTGRVQTNVTGAAQWPRPDQTKSEISPSFVRRRMGTFVWFKVDMLYSFFRRGERPRRFPGQKHQMKTLLTITAALEAGTGTALAIAPSVVVLVLLGSPLDSPAGLVIGRVLGAALFSLGTACWLARADAQGRTAAGLIAAMLLYNIAVVSLLAYARIGLGMSGVCLQPAVILHSALVVWCIACLRIARGRTYTCDALTERNVTE